MRIPWRPGSAASTPSPTRSAAGLRRAFPPDVALLPRLLRRGLFDAAHGRFAGTLQAYIRSATIKRPKQGAANRKASRVHPGTSGNGTAAVRQNPIQPPDRLRHPAAAARDGGLAGRAERQPFLRRGGEAVVRQSWAPIFIIARVLDAIQDPVIGLISDRFTRCGPRGRLAFVALMTPLLGGGFYMLFDPPDAWLGNHDADGGLADGGAGAGPSRLFRRVDQLPRHGAELSDDYNERTRVTVGREVFGLLGMTFAVVLPVALTARVRRTAGLHRCSA